MGKRGSIILQEDGTVIAHADRSLVLNQRSVFTDPELLGVGAALQKLGEAKSGLISYDLLARLNWAGCSTCQLWAGLWA